MSVQVSMSMYCNDLRMGRKTHDKQMCRDVFNIIHPYIMSCEDMDVVEQAGDQINDCWLETFTNPQKVMLSSTLNTVGKAYFDRFFLCKGNIPSARYGALVGHGPGKSILQR